MVEKTSKGGGGVKIQARGCKKDKHECKKHRQGGAGNIGKGALKDGQKRSVKKRGVERQPRGSRKTARRRKEPVEM
jgi:hypothetical protein